MRKLWHKVCGWCSRQWQIIRPGPEARVGAVLGLLAAATVAVIIVGQTLHTGFGYAFDFAFAAVAAALVILLTALLVALLLTIARHLPRRATSIMIGAGVVVMMIWGSTELGAPMAIVIGLAEGFLGATIATFFAGRFREASRSKQIITGVLCLLAVAVNVGLIWLLAYEGSMEQLVKWKPPAELMPAKLTAPNPVASGPYRVRTLFYGIGSDIRRLEYGRSVAIKTHSVDASDFFKDFQGWKRWVRRKYWGFDLDKLPLNGRVWYPEGPGPFPLALIVHGNHGMAEFSDPGYAYLGELLASRGFILASIDENFLNSGLFHDPPKQQQVRGWMLLEHLRLWREWNRSPGNPFRGKVDMDRIALMGHSRGGEAAATATLFNRLKYYPDDANIRFDYGFAIRSVVAIAPADGQYKPAGETRRINDVDYLVLQGSHDGDVSSFVGSRQWDHVFYTQPGPWFKAEIYAYRANHGQFNTEWGRDDSGGPPVGWLLNLKPLLSGDDQRRISKTYIAAFLETTLHDHREYLPLFQDWRTGRDWLPDTLYINRYGDASYVPLASFDEDADITTATASGGRIAGQGLSVWREGRIKFRVGDRGYNGVFLGWNRTGASGKDNAPVPSYTITLPEGAAAKWQLNDESILQLSVAALDEDAPDPAKKKDDKEKKPDKSKKKDRESPDFTVELVATDGTVVSTPVSRFAAIPPPLTARFTKVKLIDEEQYKQSWEAVFQTVRIPLGALPGQSRFDPTKLSAVRLKFDRTPMSVICISAVGFSKSGANVTLR